MKSDINKSIKEFASTISTQPLGLIYHYPEPFALPGYCFDNVRQKVIKDGGEKRFGWTFTYKKMLQTPENGYLVATHHAVWNSSDSKVIDITPFHLNSNSNPLKIETKILFLLDDAAKPVILNNIIAPLPCRFFPLGDNADLLAYVNNLQKKEEIECAKIYNGDFGKTNYLIIDSDKLL